ncbi:MAG: fumarylacetoacetate hydrolase family protein [Paludibacteraceae bacterium]|nr:fumarylacetoacetate hydrolase family protein [Paludibacteraceae bacterium]
MKIICVGMNYASHARELGDEPPQHPVLFMKPDSALLKSNKPFYLPDFSNRIDHEVELTVRISRLGKHISEKYAHRYYDAVGLGIDLTARDLQKEVREAGMPWEITKGFDGSAVISEFVPLERFENKDFDIRLDINGKTVQEGNTRDMLFSIDQIIAYASQFFTLKIGDILFTGTPPGVGPLHINDEVTGYLNGTCMIDMLVK